MRLNIVASPFMAVAALLLVAAASQQATLAADAAGGIGAAGAALSAVQDGKDAASMLDRNVVLEKVPLASDDTARNRKGKRTTSSAAGSTGGKQPLKEYEDDPDSIESGQQRVTEEQPPLSQTKKAADAKHDEYEDDSVENASASSDDNGGEAAGSAQTPVVDAVAFTEYDIDLDLDDEVLVRRNLRRKKTNKGGKAQAAKKFNIDFGFVGEITAQQKQGFIAARKRWQSIITKDSAATVCIPGGQTVCGFRFTRKTCIDDLFIGINIKKIDGVGNIAGSAGPCIVDETGKVRMGMMTFDREDANQLIRDGIWQSTILHEMGHVLGLGTLWDYKRLITPRSEPAPVEYFGPKGNAALNEYNGGEGKIVVEDLGGQGTARAHWKETTYDSELMTGYLEAKGKKMPLSAMTVQALADLGYEVDISKADPYTVPSQANPLTSLRDSDASTASQKFHLGNDIADWPIIEVKESDGIVKAKEGREGEFSEQKVAAKRSD